MLIMSFGLIAAITLFIVLGFIKIETRTSEGYETTKSIDLSKRIVYSVIIVVLFTLMAAIKIVPTGSTGIVTTFGRIENISLDAGVHFMAPWQKVINMDNRVQKQSITMSCFSSDIQEVNIIYTVNYQINKSNAQEIYRTIGTNYFDTVVLPQTLEAVKAVFARYTAEELIASRSSLSKEIEDILIADLAVKNIEITDTSIEDIDFTDAFTNAVEQKQVAYQNLLRAQTEQEQATIEAQAAGERQVIQAQADADAAILAAEADARVAEIAADSAEYQGQKDAAIMSNIGRQLTEYPDLIKYYYITGWNGQLPTTMMGSESELLFQVK